MDKSIVGSKKANMGMLGIGAIIASGILAVATGAVTGGVAFPVVIEGIKWVVGTYLVAQGSQDAVRAFKGQANGTDKGSNCSVPSGTETKD